MAQSTASPATPARVALPGSALCGQLRQQAEERLRQFQQGPGTVFVQALDKDCQGGQTIVRAVLRVPDDRIQQLPGLGCRLVAQRNQDGRHVRCLDQFEVARVILAANP